MAKPPPKDEQIIVKNRRATFDYAVSDKYEAGLVLTGSEVKSMRDSKVDVSDAYVSVDHGEAWLRQMFVGAYEQATVYAHDARRPRKLLLHAKEIVELERALGRGGYTVVPLRLYFKRGRAKVELGVAQGKKHYDKRADIAKRDADREARAAMRGGGK